MAFADGKLGWLLGIVARLVPVEAENADVRLRRTIGVAVILGAVPTYFLYAMVYFAHGEDLAAYIAAAGGFLFIAGHASYRVVRRYGPHWSYSMGVITATLTAIHFALGGFASSGLVIIWLLAVPVLTIVADTPRNGLLSSIAIAGAIIAAGLLESSVGRPSNMPAPVVTALFVANTLGLAAYVLLAVAFYVWQNELLGRRILEEQTKGEALLRNILPDAVISELKSRGSSEPRRHDETTILFSDFAGFTQTVGTLPPTRIVKELDEIFRAFDDITTTQGLEKIKTIGDAYMAVAGLPEHAEDHALRCVRAGLAMVAFIEARNRDAAVKWQLRIGIHSGSVVAGIVGKHKYAYDVWGDAVNIASRLESSSDAGRVNISAYTYDLVRHAAKCEYRGKLPAKGRGEIDMYFVTTVKAE